MSSRVIRSAALAASAVAVLASAAHALPAVQDQFNPPFGVDMNSQLEWQQQVTAGIGGTLQGVELFGNDNSNVVRIGLGAAVATSYVFTSPTIHFSGPNTGTGTYIDTSSAGIVLTPGDKFVIDVEAGDMPVGLQGSKSVYPGGDLYIYDPAPLSKWEDLDTTPGVTPFSLAFVTYVGDSPPIAVYQAPAGGGGAAPEPATWAMLIMGVAGIGAALRRRQWAA